MMYATLSNHIRMTFYLGPDFHEKAVLLTVDVDRKAKQLKQVYMTEDKLFKRMWGQDPMTYQALFYDLCYYMGYERDQKTFEELLEEMVNEGFTPANQNNLRVNIEELEE